MNISRITESLYISTQLTDQDVETIRQRQFRRFEKHWHQQQVSALERSDG